MWFRRFALTLAVHCSARYREDRPVVDLSNSALCSSSTGNISETDLECCLRRSVRILWGLRGSRSGPPRVKAWRLRLLQNRSCSLGCHPENKRLPGRGRHKPMSETCLLKITCDCSQLRKLTHSLLIWTGTVPVPGWVKFALDQWTVAAGITAGRIFRAVDRAGKVWVSGFNHEDRRKVTRKRKCRGSGQVR